MTLAQLIKTESKNLRGFVYSSYPYPCGLTEAMTHTDRHQAPPPSRCSITRTPDLVTIEIKPLKGSGRRKPMIIKLWTA